MPCVVSGCDLQHAATSGPTRHENGRCLGLLDNAVGIQRGGAEIVRRWVGVSLVISLSCLLLNSKPRRYNKWHNHPDIVPLLLEEDFVTRGVGIFSKSNLYSLFKIRSLFIKKVYKLTYKIHSFNYN